jgi:hypothetical protein
MGLWPERQRDPAWWARQVLDSPGEPEVAGYAPGEVIPAEVAVYFGDDLPRLYQLNQWLPVLERLHARHPTVVVTRQKRTFSEVRARTSLRCVLTPSFHDLIELYATSEFKLALYVNNSMRNFQSLAGRRMLHVHINHGESDKWCMVSNQVKAYDRVFVAGPAAMLRHRAALIEFDERKLVPVGRPQLDLRPEPVLPPTTRWTILYAPTWEGANQANNYTSLDVYGEAIVTTVLGLPGVRLVYKPHPLAAISPTPAIATAHAHITSLIKTAARRDPSAGHRIETGSDILAVFPGCDLMITDVSSVGLDFLYLHVDKPLLVTDRRNDREWLYGHAPVSRCADIIDATTLPVLGSLLSQRLTDDAHRPAREAARRHYFGELAPGESTQRFLAAVGQVIDDRDRALGWPRPVPPAVMPAQTVGVGERHG